MWDARVQFVGSGNLERKICRCDITYMNLLALIETEGYGINDSMYYVKHEG